LYRWNQVTFRESTDKILPNLDDIQQAIRRIALDINARIASLKNAIESKSSDHELHSLNNLKNCVKSAASIVSSASTTLSVDRSDRMSVAYESDFGDCFPSEPGETMLRWISSNTVYEFEEERDTASSLSGPNAASGKSLELVEEGRESDQSDSDGELEAEIIQSLLRRGKDKLASQEFEAAERHFRNCLTRTSSNGSNVSPHHVLGSKAEIMTLLLLTYRHQEKWDEARSLLMEKIALESRGSPKANQSVLADTLVLVEVLLKTCAYAEALLYGRRALKSYRKLGPEGTLGVQNSLRLLCQVCKAAGNHDEEDAYGAILSDILQRLPPAAKPITPTIQGQHDHDLMTSSKMPSLERALSVESPSVQGVNTPDTPTPNSSWISSSQSTSNSTSIPAKSHRRHSSQSSFGSSGPALPYTLYSSSATKSQEGLPNVKDPSLSNPEDISTSQSPLSNQVTCDDASKKTKDNINSRSPLSTLKNTYNEQKEGDGNQVLPTSESTKFVPLMAESDQVSDIQQSKDDAATAATATLATSSLPSSPLKLEPLEHESEPPKDQNDSHVLHTHHLTTPVILSPVSDQTKIVDHPKLPVALERIPSRSEPPNNILEQHPGFNFSHLIANHAQSNLEEAAIEYFRAKRGDPLQPEVPKPRVPVPVSDYELLQWVGTHPDFPFVMGSSSRPAVTFSEMPNNQPAVRRKVVISGDGFCGKSALVS
jgi:tetratricopeptide (TPR) repeat protein